mgnify:CR=1 FL=1
MGIGLLIGLLLAGFLRCRAVFKIQNIQDAKHYTQLPVHGIGSAVAFRRAKRRGCGVALVPSSRLELAAAIAMIPLIMHLSCNTRDCSAGLIG